MLHVLINHNPDLKKLYEEGYELEITPTFIIINHIPYIAENNSVMYGAIASTYNLFGNKITQIDHTAYFCGEIFYNLDSTPINNIINCSKKIKISDGIYSSFYLSSKPKCGSYSDFFEKFTTYINVIYGPAFALDNSVILKTFKQPKIKNDLLFNFADSPSNIEGLVEKNEKLENLKIGIVGVGGTGSYILDFLSKTRVQEIHLFDGDFFYAHNAFRSPGSMSINELQFTIHKVDFFEDRYSKMRNGIVPHPYFIDLNNILVLKDFDFIFVNVDNGTSKKLIHDFLKENKIPFIDTGIGMGLNDLGVYGASRTTIFCDSNNFSPSIEIDYSNTDNNIYQSNLQIVELNALNACHAIIRFKQYYSFYCDNVESNSIHFSLVDMENFNES